MTINALNIIPTKTASCSDMGTAAVKKKMNVSWGGRKKGDIVLFDFNGNKTSDHTGIVINVNSNGSIDCIEGNTSQKSQDNGGNVMLRNRVKGNVNFFVRPKYNETVTAVMLINTAISQLGTKEKPSGSNKVKYNTWYYGKEVKGAKYPWCMTFVEWLYAHVMDKVLKPTGKYSGVIPSSTIKSGSKGEDVKNLQRFLNWYNPAWPLAVDGDCGSNTMKGIMMFQNIEGIHIDGEYGKNSYAKANAYKQTTTPTPTPTPTPSKPSTGTTLKKPTGKYSGTIPNPTLKKGSKGKGVGNLQRFLNWYGNFGLKVDNGFGDKTDSALRKFQKTEGLKVDGIYGKQSQARAKTYKAAASKPSTSTPSVSTSANAQKLIAQMDKLAWPYGTAKKKYAYKTGAPTSACKSAMTKHGYKKKAQWSDCGDFVNTVVRESGVDTGFTSLHGVKKAFPKTEKAFNIVWSGKAIPSGLLQPGDIIRYKKTGNDQHAMFYYGNGRVCDAGHFNRFGNIRKDEKRYAGSKVKKSTIQVLRAK